MSDLLLAVAHHCAIIALILVLAMEYSALRRGKIDINYVARLDAFYGLCAVAVVGIGVARVLFGAKGAGFYLSNPWFWAKMAAFALVGLVSLAPTIMFFRWRAARRANDKFAPDAATISLQRRLIGLELCLLFVVAMCAAAMARFNSF